MGVNNTYERAWERADNPPTAFDKEYYEMSKYNSLWEYVHKNGNLSFKLSFVQIKEIAGIEIDHSFLKYKKELTEYGYEVRKISLKEQTITFNKIN